MAKYWTTNKKVLKKHKCEVSRRETIVKISVPRMRPRQAI